MQSLGSLSWHWLLAAILAALLIPSPATAQNPCDNEVIRDFRAQLDIHGDGTMTVTETITVCVMNWSINRGIYRDLYTIYDDGQGHDFRVDYEFKDIRRNAQPEPWHTAREGDFLRLYIGDEDVVITPGVHTYTITYETDRQIGFFGDYDEIYWNVTGNNWAFTIEQAQVSISLPPGAEPIDTIAFSGGLGSTQEDRNFHTGPDGSLRYGPARDLYPGHGLTVAVSWPKGFVTEPTQGQKAYYLLKDNYSLAIPLTGSALIFCLLFVAWLFVGRDPAKGVIMPQFSPPADLSPAAVRYVKYMGFDHKCFASGVLNMAVKGFLSIHEDDKKKYTLQRETQDKSMLSPGEKGLANKLFSAGNTIELKSKNHQRVRSGMRSMEASLKDEFNEKLFHTNSGWILPCFFIGLAAFIAALFFLRHPIEEAITSLMTSGSVLLTLLFAVGFLKTVFGRFTLSKFFVSLFFMLLFGGVTTFFIISTRAHGYSTPFQFAPAILFGQLFCFHRLLKSPTKAGRAVIDHIEGFLMYLETAEQHRLDVLNPPEQTPELFEKFLPYALALEVEVAWSEKFASSLAMSGQDTTYTPVWYHGTSWTGLGVRDMTTGLSSSLYSAVVSSSSSPSSSSGTGGGGFSGGGGGGGGGGGW